MDRVLIAGLFYAVLLGLCWRRPTVTRMVIGVFFAVMGIVVDCLVTVVAPSLLDELAAQARGSGTGTWPWPGGRHGHSGAFMVIVEVSIGVAILTRNRRSVWLAF